LAGPVIITRAEPGNRQTAARLEREGIAHICAPMLTLVASGEKLPSLEGVQGLLLTSANGVRAFCEVSERRDLTAWCVGPATLEAATKAGFTRTEHGDGNAADLAALVMEKANKSAGRFLHVANAAAAGKLAETLRAGGFDVEFAPLYRAEPALSMPEAALNALEGARECTVLVHSAKGASAFADLTQGLDFSAHLLVAVSEAAAAPLAGRGFGQVSYAERPNEAALMAALFRAGSTL